MLNVKFVIGARGRFAGLLVNELPAKPPIEGEVGTTVLEVGHLLVAHSGSNCEPNPIERTDKISSSST